jgi:hypothetical protein
MDGTPIYDIKPYIPYADCISEASDGYTGTTKDHRLSVEFAPDAASAVAPDTLEQIRQLVALDPRVSYDADSDKIWGMAYGRYNVRFSVAGDTATVVEIADK